MLGLGWTEIMVIGIVALIVIGPKDLPMVMQKIGKVMGQIRRMGNEFQREINKSTGLDEVRNLRKSITEPLRKSTEEIRRDFNAMTPTGPRPSGLIKPTDPAKESVADELRAAAGMPKLDAPAQSEPADGPVKAPVKAAQVTKPAKVTPMPTGQVDRADLAALGAPGADSVVAKPVKTAKPSKAKVAVAVAPSEKKPAVARAAKASSVETPKVTKSRAKTAPTKTADQKTDATAVPARKKPAPKASEAKTPDVGPVLPVPVHGGEA